MKPGMDIKKFRSELNRVGQERQDKIVGVEELTYSYGYIQDNDCNYQLNNHSSNQMCHYLDIPTSAHNKFWKDSGTRNPWDEIVNNRLYGKALDTRLLRILDGKIEAMVSTRFNIGYDAHRTYPQLLDRFVDSGMKLESSSITETHSYMKLVSPKIQGTILGQEVQFGVCTRTSDYGLERHRSDLLIYILSCLNGLVVSSVACTISRTHRGRQMWYNNEGDLEGTPDPVKIQTEMDNLTFSTMEMLNSNRIGKIVEQIEEVGKRKEEKDRKKLKKQLQGYGLGYDLESVLDTYEAEENFTRFGLSQAVTSIAQTVNSYDRSVELEQIGWSVLKG